MSTVEEPPKLHVIRYRDAHGYLQELTLSRAEARTIRTIRRAALRERVKWESRHTTFTDMGIDESNLVAVPRPRVDLGYPWEGPRYEFTWLVGESRIWQGEPVLEVEGVQYCTFCWDGPLPELSYCLGCDRCGREGDIPPPSPADLALRRIQRPKDDGLNGGRS